MVGEASSITSWTRHVLYKVSSRVGTDEVAEAASATRSAGSESSAHGLHRVVKDIFGDRRAKFLAIVCRRSKVNAGKDAGVLHFLEC